MTQQTKEHNFSYSIVLYDHSCSLCRREMSELKRRDHLQRLLMIDISHPDFDPEIWGFEPETLKQALHVRTPAGDWLVAMPAVRHIYQQVGLGWLLWPTRLPVLSTVSDQCYAWFARNRANLSGGFCTFKPGPEAETSYTANHSQQTGNHKIQA